MELLTRTDLKTLMNARTGPCVSIFMPIERPGGQTQQNPIRLKNLLREAEERLIAAGLRRPAAEELLAPAHLLVREGIFQEQLGGGLALFLSLGEAHTYSLPLDFAELVVVADHFHLAPLLPLLVNDGSFYLLAISQNDVRLLLCTRYSVKEVELKGVPRSMDEALQYDNLQQKLQFRPDRAEGGSERTAIWYGLGGEHDAVKEFLPLYFQRINAGLHRLLRPSQIPLVLAGVEYLLPIYREANTYPSLVDEEITGNPDRLSAKELHERGWAIMQPYFQRAESRAIGHYRELAGTGLTSNNLSEILLAAYEGRIESLFLAIGEERWGRFEPDTGMVHLSSDPELGNRDLLNSAALQTLIHGGDVYAIDLARMPDDTVIAAVYRY